jgi:hypothetical protein
MNKNRNALIKVLFPRTDIFTFKLQTSNIKLSIVIQALALLSEEAFHASVHKIVLVPFSIDMAVGFPLLIQPSLKVPTT